MMTKRQLIEQLENSALSDDSPVCLNVIELGLGHLGVDRQFQAAAQELNTGNYRGKNVIFISN